MDEGQRKSRKLPTSLSWPTAYRLNDNGAKEDLNSSGTIDTSGRQITVSEGHPRVNGRYLEGGPFYTDAVRHSRTVTSAKTSHRIGSNRYVYNGPIRFPAWAENAWRDASYGVRSEDLSDLDSVGATAISRCSPVNPASELSVGVSEVLRDGLPTIPGIRTWKNRTKVLLSAGEEFLNVTFGWEPLKREVEDFTSAVRHSRDILNQYSNNAGSNVRREFKFPVDSNSESFSIPGQAAIFGGVGGLGEYTVQGANIDLTLTESVEQWFSGAFTYDVPSQIDSWQGMIGWGSEADKLVGTSLTPRSLWNASPWSWAIDWFTNAGDVINNISAYVSAGQIMRYGYVMETKSSTTTFSMDDSGVKCNETGKVPAPGPMKVSHISKVRSPANPYGFGVSFSDLSPEQILIAASIGIVLLA